MLLGEILALRRKRRVDEARAAFAQSWVDQLDPDELGRRA
jgi:hypothetical protein